MQAVPEAKVMSSAILKVSAGTPLLAASLSPDALLAEVGPPCFDCCAVYAVDSNKKDLHSFLLRLAVKIGCSKSGRGLRSQAFCGPSIGPILGLPLLAKQRVWHLAECNSFVSGPSTHLKTSQADTTLLSFQHSFVILQYKQLLLFLSLFVRPRPPNMSLQ